MEIRLNGAAAAMAHAALPLLRQLDPELAHDFGLAALKCMRPLWPALPIPATLAVQSFVLQFSHPLGLAAGFDKNGDYLDALGALGFSHIELGTVTPRPQPGNPKPRMFRIPGSDALINRMGFNNKGVDHLVSRLARARYRGIRGVSIGKNFDTPIENAQDDYVVCLRKVYPYADYVAVNVSSPNTERLRELQARDGLQRIHISALPIKMYGENGAHLVRSSALQLRPHESCVKIQSFRVHIEQNRLGPCPRDSAGRCEKAEEPEEPAAPAPKKDRPAACNLEEGCESCQ